LEKEEIKKKKEKNERRGLTLTGLLMEGIEQTTAPPTNPIAGGIV
jgi:hypothetical protein